MAPNRFWCILALAAMFMSPLRLLSQSKYSLGFSGSFPVGSFASTAPGNGSFAKPGWSIMFENEAHFRSWPKIFALGLHLSYQENSIDNKAMAREFTLALGARTEVSGAKYRPFLATVGPFFDIPVTPKFDIGIKTGIGFVLPNIDSFELTVFPAGQEADMFEIDFKSSPSFTFLLGLNGEYKLSHALNLTVFADYSRARTAVDSFIGSAGRVRSDYDLLFVNVGLGIAVILE